MGMQSQGIQTLIKDSENNLMKIASNEYNLKYFSIKECCDNPDLKLNFLVKTIFNSADCCITKYLDKKFKGTPEKTRGERLEITWECGKLINLCIK